MLTIRLTRVGKRKQPHYRLIISEKTRDPWDRSLENLSNYNPHTSPSTVNFKADRIKYWLSQGATTSDTVWNLLIDKKIVEGDKRRKVKISKRRMEKLAQKEAGKKKAEAPKAEAPTAEEEKLETKEETPAPESAPPSEEKKPAEEPAPAPEREAAPPSGDEKPEEPKPKEKGS